MKAQRTVASRNPYQDSSLILDQVKDWVIEQTRERIMKQLEADELAYQERLLSARKREESMRRAARARVMKRPVWSAALLHQWYSCTNSIPEMGC
jgi:chromosome transmission fidelity protein 1